MDTSFDNSNIPCLYMVSISELRQPFVVQHTIQTRSAMGPTRIICNLWFKPLWKYVYSSKWHIDEYEQ